MAQFHISCHASEVWGPAYKVFFKPASTTYRSFPSAAPDDGPPTLKGRLEGKAMETLAGLPVGLLRYISQGLAISDGDGIPDAQLIIYPDANHGSLYQYPERFVTHVAQFRSEDPAHA